MKIDKVIMATDLNEEYIGFWNVVSKVWKEEIGIEPVLYVISDKKVNYLSEQHGKVHYYSPEKSIATSHQAQVIRHFAAAQFPNDNCIITDIDMMPLNRGYYTALAQPAKEEDVIIYSADAYPPGHPSHPAFPMCYICAKGSTFLEIIGGNIDNFSTNIHKWMDAGFGWSTDEKYFYHLLEKWSKNEGQGRIVLYRRGFNSGDHTNMHRIDRSEHPYYDLGKLESGGYIDYHMPRPFSKYGDFINNILKHNRTEY